LYHSCRSCMRKEAVCFYCPHQQLKSPSIFDETYKFSGKNISFLGCRRPKQKVLLIVLKINWLVSLQKNFQCSGILAGNSFSFKRGSLRSTETTSQPPIWKKKYCTHQPVSKLNRRSQIDLYSWTSIIRTC